jgi:hypothetical protein
MVVRVPAPRHESQPQTRKVLGGKEGKRTCAMAVLHTSKTLGPQDSGSGPPPGTPPQIPSLLPQGWGAGPNPQHRCLRQRLRPGRARARARARARGRRPGTGPALILLQRRQVAASARTTRCAHGVDLLEWQPAGGAVLAIGAEHCVLRGTAVDRDDKDGDAPSRAGLNHPCRHHPRLRRLQAFPAAASDFLPQLPLRSRGPA